MAQLHRRVRRLPHRYVGREASRLACAAPILACAAPILARAARVLCIATAVGSMLSVQPGPVRAQSAPASPAAHTDTAPSAAELAQLASELASADPNLRKRAYEALLALGEDALPAIKARLGQLGSRVATEQALTAISNFRRVQGSASPELAVDILAGVLPVLAKDRSRATVDTAELVLYLRALEAQKTPAAAHVIVGQLFAVEPKLFRYEGPRTHERLGVLMLPALVRHRTHSRPWIRDFCASSLLEMHMDTPGRAVQQDDVVLLAALLTAYGDTLTFDAMPVIVSYLTDERVAVREAAATAVRRFGKNAIWQLRERYLNATGKEAPTTWGHQRILDELYAVHDEPRRRGFELALSAARSAIKANEHDRAAEALTGALDIEPQSTRARAAAPLYAQLAASYLENGELERALSAYRRALRLLPDGQESARFQARVRYIEAELRLDQGVVDLAGYQHALNLDPSLAQAQDTLDVMSGERAARARLSQRIVGFIAALLMLVAAFALLRSARLSAARSAVPKDETSSPAKSSEPEPNL